MEQHPIVSLMQNAYTKSEHEKLRKEAKKIEFKLPDSPTLEKPDYIVNEDLVHSLAGTVQMGAVGFDTFGMGSGHQTARSLWDVKGQEEIYNYDGDERLNTAAVVWNNLDFGNPRAVLANSLYQVFAEHIGRSFDEDEFDEILPLIRKILRSFWKVEKDHIEYSHINTKNVKKLFEKLTETSSFWADCELMVKFISNTKYAGTVYTYSTEFNDLTQDVHYTMDEGREFAGLYFHTGCDARCGFSSPVFGTLTDEWIETTSMGFYHQLEEEFGKDYEHMDLLSFLRSNSDSLPDCDGRIPYEDEGSGTTYWLRENGWITIELNEQDKVGNYYTDREVKLTEKAIIFIKVHNPRQKKLDEFVK